MGTKTMTVTFPESTVRSKSQTVTILNLKSVESVSVNTGNVTYSVNGNNITINVSNGTYTRYTTSTYTDSKALSDVRKEVVTGHYWKWTFQSLPGHPNGGWYDVWPSLPSSVSHTTADGYSGTLTLRVIGGYNPATRAPMPTYNGTTEGEKVYDAGATQYGYYDGTVYKNITTTTYYYAYTVTIMYIDNTAPTVTLTTADNQVLSEGNAFSIQGSVQDTDSGNVVTVKYKINSGTARAVVSGVSDGSSPLSFARTLTCANKRLWDGATDISGADLAEGVDHTLTVWAEDDQGGKSEEITRKFRVIHNRPPAISGQDGDMGTINTPPSLTYTVTDPEGSTFTVTEKINDTVIRTFTGQPGVENTMTIPHDLWLPLEPGVPQTLKIEATDSAGITSVRTYMFTRAEDRIVFDGLDFANLPPDLLDKFTTDVPARRILLTPDWTIPPGAVVLVEACNNAFDAQPTWEDVTFHARNNRGYLFLNQQKTADKWGVNFRFTIEKGTATDPIIVKGIGGAFD
jgi:hypothetical protein